MIRGVSGPKDEEFDSSGEPGRSSGTESSQAFVSPNFAGFHGEVLSNDGRDKGGQGTIDNISSCILGGSPKF